MASIKTNIGREKLAKAHNGSQALPEITTVVFGSGGTDEAGAPKALTGEELSLFNQEVSKTGSELTKSFPVPSTARYSCAIDTETDGLDGVKINEAGLLDADGDLVAMKTFTDKGMDEGTTIEFDYDAEF